jgi:hypothetical protein
LIFVHRKRITFVIASVFIISFVYLSLPSPMVIGGKSSAMNNTTVGFLAQQNMTSLSVSLVHLPTGSWHVVVNGSRGFLDILSIDNSSGIVEGTIRIQGQTIHPIRGFYDQISAKLTFIRIMNPNDPLGNQIFTGYMNGVNRLAGYFQAPPGSGGASERSIFGWYADI